MFFSLYPLLYQFIIRFTLPSRFLTVSLRHDKTGKIGSFLSAPWPTQEYRRNDTFLSQHNFIAFKRKSPHIYRKKCVETSIFAKNVVNTQDERHKVSYNKFATGDHSFGIGIGTPAEGWMERALEFAVPYLAEN